MISKIILNIDDIRWLFLIIFFGSGIITAFIIPKIIKVVNYNNLMDKPNKRSSHSTATPTFGGLAFYIVIILSILVSQYFDSDNISIYFISSLTILFFTGLKDDLIVLTPISKIISQLFSIILILINSKLIISHLHGFLTLNEVPLIIGVFISVILMLTIINAYNLIDGIDGLAATIGLLIIGIFTILFYISKQYYFVLLGGAVEGTLLVFLKFNLSSKKKIFMGDSGSLIIGLVIAVMTLKFLTLPPTSYFRFPFIISTLPVILVAILIIPIFDTSRVFVIRVLNKKSPFSPDRNHIHHILLDFGLSHKVASLFLGVLNIVISFLFIGLATYGVVDGLLLLYLFVFSICLLVFFSYINRENKKTSKREFNTKLFFKYSFDFVFSLLVIVLVLTWLTPIIYILVVLTTNEKLFYFQERIGKNGKSFKMIKFRTMKGSPPTNDPLLSEDEKHRITKLGGFLRKYRIDELPQFVNVLKGDMSIVGPRPERQFFLTKIYERMPKYKKMLRIKPGITSLGQIKFGYADNLEEMLKRAKFDYLYIDNINFYSDIIIILLTLKIVLLGKGK